jgi:hypothetical protein
VNMVLHDHGPCMMLSVVYMNDGYGLKSVWNPNGILYLSVHDKTRLHDVLTLHKLTRE